MGFWKIALGEKQGRRDTNFHSCDLCLTEASISLPLFFLDQVTVNMKQNFFLVSQGMGAIMLNRIWAHRAPWYLTYDVVMFMELDLKSPGEERPTK